MKSLGKRPGDLRLERMRSSPLWAGEAFRNVHPILPRLRDPNAQPMSVSDFLCGGERRVPHKELPSLNPRDVWSTAPSTGLRATWLGHSTVLIEIDGHRVLTDPVWGSRASPSRLVGPKRFQPVPVALRSLPPLDAVIVSHDHYDHLDFATIRELAKLDVPFVTSLGVGAHLEAWGVQPERIVELDWWESYTLPNAELVDDCRAVAAFLRSRAPRSQRDAVVIDDHSLAATRGLFQRRHRVDDGVRRHPRATGPVRPRHAGGGRFPSVVGRISTSGPRTRSKRSRYWAEAVFLPVHWGTFALALHDWDQPAEALLTLAPKQGAELLMPRLGEPVEPEHENLVTPWWRAADLPDTRQQPSETPVMALPKAMPWPFD